MKFDSPWWKRTAKPHQLAAHEALSELLEVAIRLRTVRDNTSLLHDESWLTDVDRAAYSAIQILVKLAPHASHQILATERNSVKMSHVFRVLSFLRGIDATKLI